MIKVEDLHVSYHGDEVVNNINFHFKPGSLIGIIGPNGAGKSTMIKGVLELIPKDKGKVSIYGESIKKRRKDIAYVPQKSNLDWDFPINVFNTVLMGTYPDLGLFRRPGKKEKELAMKSLKRVGMEEYWDRQIGQLSGGQQQRVFLARALTQEANIYFLDEPFVGIDMASEKSIIKILKELKDENKILFVVNHDLSKVESYFTDLILMNRYLIGSGTVEEVFTNDKITEAYGIGFNVSDPGREENQ